MKLENSGDIKNMKMSIEFSDECPHCNFHNMNIWGTIIDGTSKIDVRCMRCGKPLLLDQQIIPTLN